MGERGREKQRETERESERVKGDKKEIARVDKVADRNRERERERESEREREKERERESVCVHEREGREGENIMQSNSRKVEIIKDETLEDVQL